MFIGQNCCLFVKSNGLFLPHIVVNIECSLLESTVVICLMQKSKPMSCINVVHYIFKVTSPPLLPMGISFYSHFIYHIDFTRPSVIGVDV